MKVNRCKILHLLGQFRPFGNRVDQTLKRLHRSNQSTDTGLRCPSTLGSQMVRFLVPLSTLSSADPRCHCFGPRTAGEARERGRPNRRSYGASPAGISQAIRPWTHRGRAATLVRSGSVYRSVEDEGPPSMRLASTTRGTTITTPESEDGRTDAPTVHPRPRYCRRSVPGPTAVERRRWLGLDRRTGRG